jgi:AraC-like DNA-binding protein
MTHMSRCHFCHTFRNVTGKNLQEYVNELRVEKAKILLRDTDLNITEIANSVGFNDLNYFSRVFKRGAEVSPRKFRRGKWSTLLN